MGIRHPECAYYLTAAWPAAQTPPCSAATVQARSAYIAAAKAAIDHAVARAALHRITTELTLTRLRVRALQRHWLPQLRTALAAVEFELEEQERAEALRRRFSRSAWSQ